MEHFNFCRQLTKQATILASVPNLPELDQARLLHAMDLCRASQKFLLPDGGRLLDDVELRALDETARLRLPHPFTALEYMATREADEPGMTELARRRIVFMREDADSVLITPAWCYDATGIWVLAGECRIPATGYLDRSQCTARGIPFVRTAFPRGHDPRDYYDEISVALSFLNALQCSNVRIERSTPKSMHKKIKAPLPFDAYHVLTIDVPSGAVDGSRALGPHRSPRQHLRRGHIRRLTPTRCVWVNATVVNASVASRVLKDYLVRAC